MQNKCVIDGIESKEKLSLRLKYFNVLWCCLSIKNIENNQTPDLVLPTNRIPRGKQSSMKIDQMLTHILGSKKAEIHIEIKCK